jgi:HSP20 family protein
VWSPPTDVYETEENYVIKIEIAGMRDEDFEVAFENNILMITGYRSDLNERRAYHQMEIRFGRFEIAVEIFVSVDVEKATAEYRDGFLTIVLPKPNTKPDEDG